MQSKSKLGGLCLEITSVKSGLKEIIHMSTLSSKPTKTYKPVELISVFVFLALILALLVIPLTGNLNASLSTALGNGNGTHFNVSGDANYSFSADQQYWATN